MSKWQPIRWREPTEEEKKNIPIGIMITDDPLPEDGEGVLVTVKWRHYLTKETHYIVSFDRFDRDYVDWGRNKIDDVIAWMPCPEPYKEEA